jgi:hypothetical protein
MATMKCSACGQSYESHDIEILGHRDELWFMRVHCAACKTHVLIAAVVKESKAPAISDLNKKEYLRFKKMGVVGDEEVLDMHNFLRDFDGDFQKIFGGQ